MENNSSDCDPISHESHSPISTLGKIMGRGGGKENTPSQSILDKNSPIGTGINREW